MKNRYVIILDGDYPPRRGRTDYHHYIKYFIERKYVSHIICGREFSSVSDYDNIPIIRPRQYTTVESRKSEAILLVHYLISCYQYKDKYESAFLFYNAAILPTVLLLRMLNKRVIIDFRSVPIKRKVAGKILRTLNAFFAHKITLPETALVHDMFYGRVNKRKVNHLPLGVNISQINRIISSDQSALISKFIDKSEQKTIRFVSLGTIHSTRRLEDVVDAFTSVEQKNVSAQLIFIGDGPHFNKFQKYVTLKNDQNIILTGALPFENAIALCGACDIGITYYPIELYNNQPPLKTVEYLAAGLYVIAVNSHGNRKLIKHGENGLLIADNKNAIQSAIDHFISNDYQLDDYSKTLTDLTGYDYTEICRKYLEKVI